MTIKKTSQSVVPMHLKTFSRRFNVSYKLLFWGVARITIGENEPKLHTAVLISGIFRYIDIAEDEIKSSISEAGHMVELFPCTLRKTKKFFIFENKDNRIQVALSRREVEAFYASKIFSTQP